MRAAPGLILLFVCVMSAASGRGAEPAAAPVETVLVEAEGFEELGGWVVDQQFMDQMGSPMLLAHGMGTPVEDAATTVTFPAAGRYRVFVRTRDWVGPWKAPGAPGRFQVLIDGTPLETTFGTEGAQWRWQDGGTVQVSGAKATVALHDLTGFDGRCDSIVFAAEDGPALPNRGQEMAAFRKRLLALPERPEEVGRFDLVVVGGGMAGTCTAISAARLGLEVVLIQDRPVLGGNNSSEVRVHLGGNIHQEPYPALGGVVREIGPGQGGNAQPAANYEDEKKLRVVRAERRLHLFLNTHAYQVEMLQGRIAAVLARDVRTGKELRFAAPLFADCTGDGTIGFLAGADYHYGRESRQETDEALAPETADRQTMGTSVMWYSVETDAPTTFPDCPWAIQFNAQNYQKAISGNWNWETGFRLDQIEAFETVRDHGLRAVYGNWAFQKNHAPDKARYANRKLGWVAYIGGKRESRRLLGDVILRQQDVVDGKVFPDACVTATWSIDLHYPIQSDQFPGAEFRSRAEFLRTKAYPIPYRCLYSRNVDNLFMAGRNISVTHVALGTVRVMRTTGMMGEVVGMAASICRRFDSDPRQVYTNYLSDLQERMRRGVGRLPVPDSKPPSWLGRAGPNLARSAKVSVSSRHDSGQYPVENINDGRVSYTDNSLRWVSDTGLPDYVEFSWDKPQRISAVRIVTGQRGGSGGPATPITNFVLQYPKGSIWDDIPPTRVTGNMEYDWHATFPAMSLRRIRLVVSATPGELTRIWELELYDPFQNEESLFSDKRMGRKILAELGILIASTIILIVVFLHLGWG